MQRRQHRRVRHPGRHDAPHPRPHLADRQDRPVCAHQPGQRAWSRSPARGRRDARGPDGPADRADPAAVDELPPQERGSPAPRGQLWQGHQGLGGVHDPDQPDRPARGWRRHVGPRHRRRDQARRQDASAGREDQLPQVCAPDRRRQGQPEAQPGLRRQHVQHLPGAGRGRAGRDYRGDARGEDVPQLDELARRQPLRQQPVPGPARRPRAHPAVRQDQPGHRQLGARQPAAMEGDGRQHEEDRERQLRARARQADELLAGRHRRQGPVRRQQDPHARRRVADDARLHALDPQQARRRRQDRRRRDHPVGQPDAQVGRQADEHQELQGLVHCRSPARDRPGGRNPAQLDQLRQRNLEPRQRRRPHEERQVRRVDGPQGRCGHLRSARGYRRGQGQDAPHGLRRAHGRRARQEVGAPPSPLRS
eukprot:Unigene1074_Nuclearia_a/m.3422 Unigene1074_Nuclearia_a/g.3422  ORF Unigene1074_Nuclearia_a/g.3422 Unigene1074_Nuclearia_a/m.3422 type:complete len:422 (-) Unigene1074_Nuclearia_a:73-1338(-)